jgi:hypothetical protein
VEPEPAATDNRLADRIYQLALWPLVLLACYVVISIFTKNQNVLKDNQDSRSIEKIGWYTMLYHWLHYNLQDRWVIIKVAPLCHLYYFIKNLM